MHEPEIDIHATDLSALLEQARPDPVPPATQAPKIPTSVRLPLPIYERLRQVADARGIGHTQLMLQYIEAGLAGEVDAQQVMVPLADLQQAIARIAARSAPAA
jgi:hypothetical protein